MNENPAKLNVLVFGAGAIGGYLGGSLALQGHRVVFLERERNALGLRERGVKLTIGNQTHHLNELGVVTSIQEALRLSSYDVAFFALKSYDTVEALKSVQPYAAELPPFLCLQNGVENEAALAEILDADKVIAGTVTTAVAKDGLGQIRLERLRGVGLAAGHPLSARLAMAMNEAGLNVRLYEDAAAMKWSKLLTNLLTNASCAILDLSPAQVMAHPGLFKIEMRHLREALDVMGAMGFGPVDLPGTPVRALAFGARLPAALARPLMARAVGRGRGGKMPSLHIDLHAGKGRSEVDWLNGAVVRAGQRLGIDTPVNRFLNETLQNLAKGKVETNPFSHEPNKFLQAV